jgi:uncharacterized protein (TIGR02996 family)
MATRRMTTRKLAPRTARRASVRDGEAELLAQIYAAPDDDGPRLVYADWLQERGDPRGEFIALQLERAGGRARSGGRQRENALAAKHANAWSHSLGVRSGRSGSHPGGTLPARVHFGRGFAETVATGVPINADPAWSTVTTCNLPPTDDRCQVRSLRVVTGARNQDIAALATLREPLAIEELVWGHGYDPARTWMEARDPTITKPLRRAFERIAVLPRLRRLELSPKIVGDFPDPAELAWAWTAPTCAHLEQVRVPGNELSDWIPALAPTKLARFELIQSVSEYGWQVDTRIVVERDAKHRFSLVTAYVVRGSRRALDALRLVFDACDRGVVSKARIAIANQAEWDKSATQRGALTRTLHRRGVEATLEKSST